jgi:hypothetical protein
MMWYMTTKPCYVSVMYIRVSDPGGTEWYRRRCTGLAFVRVSIFLTSHGHVTLVVTSHGSLRGTRVSSYLVHPWPINGGLSTISGTHDHIYELFFHLSEWLGAEGVRKWREV